MPRSLNRRLAPSSNSERIRRPAVRVARAACLGSPATGSAAVSVRFGAMVSYLPTSDNCMLYKQTMQDGYSHPTAEPKAFGAWGCFTNIGEWNPFSSWPGLSRPSTFFVPGAKDVDARHKAGHDGLCLRAPLSLAIETKTLIRRASVDPGRELNGRSQQSPFR